VLNDVLRPLGSVLTAVLLTACAGDDADDAPADASTSGMAGSSSGEPEPDPDPSTTGEDPGTSSSSSSSGGDASTSGDDTSGTSTEGDDSSGGEESSSTGSDPVCGDGVVEGDEACDDAGESATCNADCSVSMCGDGIVNVTADEECDGGDGCNVSCLAVCAGFSAASFATADLSFDDFAGSTPIAMAWDGVSYWSVGGGGPGVGMAEYDAAGVHQQTLNPGLDFRSLFTQGEGVTPLYARSYNDATIWVDDGGTFSAHVSLATAMPGLYNQSSVVWDEAESEYVAAFNGTVIRWSADGSFIGSTELLGFGDAPYEHEVVNASNSQIAWAERCILTYSNGSLSAWDAEGNRVDTADLLPMYSANEFSLSYANGMVWISDGTTWQGVNVF